jgi:hypothetical protein
MCADQYDHFRMSGSRNLSDEVMRYYRSAGEAIFNVDVDVNGAIQSQQTLNQLLMFDRKINDREQLGIDGFRKDYREWF